MTTTATQLAAALEEGWACDTSPDEMTAAAAELRRLSAEVVALRQALAAFEAQVAEPVANVMAVVEEAFHDGFSSRETYNDTVLNDPKTEWEAHREGYAKALAAAVAQAEPAWLPIETAPTQEGQRFIGLAKSGRAVTAEPAYYVYDAGPVRRGWLEVERGSLLSVELKGWMPLPQPPKENLNG